MIEIGRLCVKTAGRDARMKAVIVEILDDNFVVIDGETRRRKVNIKHIEPLAKVFAIESGVSHDDVVALFEKELGVKIAEKKPKEEKPKAAKADKPKSAAKPKKTTKKA